MCSDNVATLDSYIDFWLKREKTMSRLVLLLWGQSTSCQSVKRSPSRPSTSTLKLQIPLCALNNHPHVSTLDGAPIGKETITHYTLRIPLLSGMPQITLASTRVKCSETQVFHSWAIYRFHQISSVKPKLLVCLHIEYDWAIDLLSATSPPQGRVYSVSLKEQRAMEEYIQEALQQGYIVPSTSPASASFFLLRRRTVVWDPV